MREASDFQWILVYSIVLFTLVILQQFSEARKKIARFQMGAIPIQVSDFCKQTCKINIKIAWKNSQCEYAKIYRFRTKKNHSLEKIASVNKPLPDKNWIAFIFLLLH